MFLQIRPTVEDESNNERRELEEIGELDEYIRNPNELSIADLAKRLKDIENGDYDSGSPFQIPYSHNTIPGKPGGSCKSLLIGYIIDKKDFENRIPHILAHFIRCKHKNVLLCVCYWNGADWEKKWKEPFGAVGGQVYRKMLDSKHSRIEKII